MPPSNQRPTRRRAERSPSSGGEGPSNTNARRDLNIPDLNSLDADDELTFDQVLELLKDFPTDLEEEDYPEGFDPNNIDYKKLFPMFDLENMPIIDNITKEDIEEMLNPNTVNNLIREIEALGEDLPDIPEMETEEDMIRQIKKIEEEARAKIARHPPESLKDVLARLPAPNLDDDGPAPTYPLSDHLLREYRKFKDSMDPNIHDEPKIQRRALEKYREDCARLGDILRIMGRPPNEEEIELLKKNEGYAKGTCDNLANYYQMHAALVMVEEHCKTGCYGKEKTPNQVYNEEMARWREEYNNKSEFEKYGNLPEFIDFKRTVWESLYDTPVPPPRKWFSDAGDDSDDDEIGISAVKISYKCPLTLQIFEKPLTNRTCKHSFEKAAIHSLIEQHEKTVRARDRTGEISCPVAGCNAKVSKGSLSTDSVFVRGLKRHKELEEIRAMEKELNEEPDWGEIDPDCIDEDGSYHPERSKRPKKPEAQKEGDKDNGGEGSSGTRKTAEEIKKEKMASMPKRIVLDDDDDDEDL